MFGHEFVLTCNNTQSRVLWKGLQLQHLLSKQRPKYLQKGPRDTCSCVFLWQSLRQVWWLWQMTVAVVMAPMVSRPSASAQTVLDLFKVHVGAKQLASARAKAGQWFDCSTDKERYFFVGEYQCLVQAIIDLDPYILKSTLYEVFLQLNQWQRWVVGRHR